MLDRFKALVSTYAAMPGELRTIAAMVMLALPLGIGAGGFYVFRDMFNLGTAGAILALVGVLVALVVLALLIIGLRAWFAARRRDRMGRMLSTAGSGGPTAMAGGDIPELNKKFRRSVDEMRKHGWRVYDMPWYIVVGDSGCGKTKLVNESGLQFPLGRPEEITGSEITVGTKDYNWWFTEQMIFIDMAGKLVNPQEESGHQTWLGMLKIIARGRPAVPINGAVVCVSVEDLVGNPEKRRRDAENMQLRLRELQMHLGVTFPTYVVVTKCDLIPGFLEFYRKVGRDLLLRHQIMGWARPGSFSTPYDADSFPTDFEDLCRRMHALRLKRLSEEDDDVFRENAYCFPEHFRHLGGPLHEYVSTVFPQFKNTRGVSQLLFRGLFFTSATQDDRLLSAEGGLAGVLRGMKNLYEKPEPHFLKDLLLKKVNPEMGLVYRNEAQLKRNRRLAVGLVVSSILLLVLGGWGMYASYFAFDRLIAEPREHARIAVAEHIEKQPKPNEPAGGSPDDALRLANALTNDVRVLQQTSWASNLLSMMHDPRGPQKDLMRIRAGVFERRLLPDLAEAARKALAARDRESPTRLPQNEEKALLEAIRAYLKWNAASAEAAAPKCLSADDLLALANVAKVPGATGDATFLSWNAAQPADTAPASAEKPTAIAPTTTTVQFRDVAREYMDSVADPAIHAGNPAAAFRGEEGAGKAADALQSVLGSRALLRTDDNDPPRELQPYVRLALECEAIDTAYARVNEHLASAQQSAPDSEPAAEKFGRVFRERADALRGAADNLTDLPPAIETAKLWDLVKRYRKAGWLDELDRIQAACEACGRAPAALARSREALDSTFARRLGEVKLATAATFTGARFATPADPSAASSTPDDFVGLPANVGHLIEAGGKPGEAYRRSKDIDVVVARVVSLATRFAGGSATQPATPTLESLSLGTQQQRDWLAGAKDELATPLSVSAAWKARQLVDGGKDATRIAARLGLTQAARTLVTGLAPTAGHAWGIAELRSRWNCRVDSKFDVPPTMAANLTPAEECKFDPERGREAGGDSTLTPGPSRTAAPAGDHGLPAAATAPFLWTTADQAVMVLTSVSLASDALYEPELKTQLDGAISSGWKTYVDKYAAFWREAAGQSAIGELAGKNDWNLAPKDDRRAALKRYVDDFRTHVVLAGARTVGEKFYRLDNWSLSLSSGKGDNAELGKAEYKRFYADLTGALKRAFDDIKPGDEAQARIELPQKYVEAWQRTHDDVTALTGILSGSPPAPGGPTGVRMNALREFAKDFGCPSFPAVANAATFEANVCMAFAERGANERRELYARGIGAVLTTLNDKNSHLDVIARYVASCMESFWPNQDDWRDAANAYDRLRMATVMVEPLKIDLRVGDAAGPANVSVEELFEKISIAITPGNPPTWVARNEYPRKLAEGVKVEDVPRVVVKVDGPRNGVTPGNMAIQSADGNSVVELVRFIMTSQPAAALAPAVQQQFADRGFDFVTIHEFAATSGGKASVCRIGLGWSIRKSPVASAEARDDVKRLWQLIGKLEPTLKEAGK